MGAMRKYLQKKSSRWAILNALYSYKIIRNNPFTLLN